MATALAAFRAQINQPIRGTNHIQIVLNHHQRMPGIQQLAQRTHQLGNVIKVQAGGGFVQHEQRTTPRHGLAAGAAALGSLGQKTGQLEALRLATRKRGHGLPQLHVFQTHIDNRLQHADHIAVGAEQIGGLTHRQVQHIGHIQGTTLALDRHLQNLGAIALAIAVRAAQIYVAEELHLDVFEARATTGRATAIATVEAELGTCVAALTRQRGHRKQLTNRVPGTDITDRVGTCGFANRRLINKHDFAQQLSTHQTLVRAGRFCGLAKVAQQRRRQHVLHQCGFAGATDAGDADQTLQRDFDIDVLQVVFGHPFQNQARGVFGHHALEAHADLFATAQVSTGQGVGTAQFIGGAVKDNLPALLARTGAHVDHAISRQHHRRVMLDHHQRIARVPQALHGHDDAVHVTRVQSDAGFVQHEECVNQACAQCGGQVDALHLAATEGATLAVQRQITNADVAQIFQPSADFFEQQLQGSEVGFATGRVCFNFLRRGPLQTLSFGRGIGG